MAAVPSSEKTGEIRSASSGGLHALTTNTCIVIGGASGDLAKKKVSPLQIRRLKKLALDPVGSRLVYGVKGGKIPRRAGRMTHPRDKVDFDKPRMATGRTADHLLNPALIYKGSCKLTTLPLRRLGMPADFPGLVRVVPERIPTRRDPHHRICPIKDGQGRESTILPL